MANNDELTKEIEVPESRSRRKAVKTLVGGAAALAAYHVLPVKWDTPIIEQVFLPAHAQTSGELEPEVTSEPEVSSNQEPVSTPDVCASDYEIGVVNNTSAPAVDVEVAYTSASGPVVTTVGPGISTFSVACNDTTMTITSPDLRTFMANGVTQVTTSVTITVDSNKGVFVSDFN